MAISTYFPLPMTTNKRYLIFSRGAHPVVYFVHGQTTGEATWNYIRELSPEMKRNADGSISDGAIQYSHPLAYIEATEKIYHEWQIRELPDWTWTDGFSEIFCGESQDGPLSDIEECREHFSEAFPRSRAKAFVWCLKQGHLVTFYRKLRASKIKVLKRYLLNWSGRQMTIEEWIGGYEEIVDALDLLPPRWRSEKQGGATYPFRPPKEVLNIPHG
ncbi:MAG: hypothetical protein ACRYFS_07470, partial [Janthinobacterium lividum]